MFVCQKCFKKWKRAVYFHSYFLCLLSWDNNSSVYTSASVVILDSGGLSLDIPFLTSSKCSLRYNKLLKRQRSYSVYRCCKSVNMTLCTMWVVKKKCNNVHVVKQFSNECQFSFHPDIQVSETSWCWQRSAVNDVFFLNRCLDLTQQVHFCFRLSISSQCLYMHFLFSIWAPVKFLSSDPSWLSTVSLWKSHQENCEKVPPRFSCRHVLTINLECRR